jgi:hypothetical protein
MPTRHRTPSIFNISMVDVLCCALGCVILLWLLNLRDAKEKAATVGTTSNLLARSKQEADDLRAQLRDREEKLRQIEAERDQARQLADATRQDLTAARARLAALDKDAAALKQQVTTAQDRLTRLTQDQNALSRAKADALTRVEELQARLRDQDKQAAKARKQALDLAEQLEAAEGRARQMQELADQLPNLRKELQGYRAKLDAATDRVRALEADSDKRSKELADSDRRLEAWQREKQALTDEVNRARAAADNRFAGIALTGRRVVFLVDMSGSMEYVEPGKPAPDKWTGVRETLVKLMRSLPELEKFQVILFSDRVLFPMAPESQWVDFDGRTSVLQVMTTMAAIRPRGETNMYAGLEATFRFRASGLDTVYLLSDGLPSTGEGLPVGGARPLTDREKAETLSQHIRRVLKTRWNVPAAGQPRVRINTIGFFYESPDVGAFLWALARENDGSFVGMSKP